MALKEAHASTFRHGLDPSMAFLERDRILFGRMDWSEGGI